MLVIVLRLAVKKSTEGRSKLKSPEIRRVQEKLVSTIKCHGPRLNHFEALHASKDLHVTPGILFPNKNGKTTSKLKCTFKVNYALGLFKKF